MPATITTRAITIHMRRRRPDEQVEPFRERSVELQARPLRTALAEWVSSVAIQIADAEPMMPYGVTDRSAEIWEPLIAIADAAGDHWPNTARAACEYFVHTHLPSADSVGVELLADLRDLFSAAGTDRLATRDIVAALRTMDDAPWSALADQPLGPRRLARELARYGVRPVTFDAKIGKAKGYVTFPTTGKQAQLGLADAWLRYLPEATNAGTSRNSAGQAVTPDHSVTDGPAFPSPRRVTDSGAMTGRDNALIRSVTDVPPRTHGRTT
jgi:hypothetical protein